MTPLAAVEQMGQTLCDITASNRTELMYTLWRNSQCMHRVRHRDDSQARLSMYLYCLSSLCR
ncbi:hypothetical protein CANCADRAFT_86215 [Tortispora caseinolytica NRRL Y-17796]|uniref:Uncharacterized protein n=1 Tax=Tortispora caseinolytica NRRL Y-17796 TaxID=767744 RepID=A0A1E4TKW4_9ASCO|nr:hypothetical protein CANCADRAFT_86215 [Tortispora caseinolytica NRRL Y-17796]